MMNTNQTDCKKLNLNPAVLKKAMDGDAIAQVTLGKAYFHAVHFENNCLSAFEWFSRSAEQDNMEAQFLLANLYTLGQGTKKNHIEAYKWYIKAALQGYKKASIRLHNLYQQDKKLLCRGKIHSEEALKVKEAAFRSVTHYHKELNEQRLEDYKNKFSDTIIDYTGQFNEHKYDNHDDSDKQLNLGFLYQYGYGVKRSILLAFEYYEKAAEKGHRDAQYHLAALYQRNTNIKFNYRKALRWYRASATNGNIAAQNNLAYFYEKGLSIDLNYEGAVYWYTEAANNGNSDAQLNLGRLYRKGQGVEQSFLEAGKWYKLAALQGNTSARNCLDQLFQNRKLGDHSDTETLSEYKGDRFSSTTALRSKLQNDINRLTCSPKIKELTKISQHALRTDGNAMYIIGLKYYNGEDFPQDKDTGFQWINKAAKAGNQEAEIKIAKMYEDGDTVEQDYHKSSIWTMKLVKKKNAEAQCKLGILYKNGLGVRKDPLEASKWFIMASDQKNRDALYQFGLLKFDGEGVRQDGEEAFKYFYISALSGQPDAFFRLGYMYESGQYVEKDKPKAVQMYEYAAKLGYVHAQFRLGRLYEEGSLTQKDLVKALKHYTMAADSGEPSYRNELAIKYLNGVFDDPNFTKAYDLIKQAPKKESLIEGIVFNKPVIHFTEIDDVSKIIDMLILATERGEEHIAYEIGYAYEFGLMYGYDEGICPHQKGTMKWYYSSIYASSDIDWKKWQIMRYMNRVKAKSWYDSGNENIIHNHNCGLPRRSVDVQNKLFYNDYTHSMKWYFAAARRGDSRAHYRLGTIYEEGKGVNKDLKIAFDYYTQAYESGNSNAAYSLAFMYMNGNGVSQDLMKAFHLFSEASYMGHADATEMLVPSITRGNLEMLKTAAAHGYVALQYHLGIFYQNEKDLESFKWLSLSARGGMVDACYKMGLIFEEGRIISVDYSKAIKFYEKASRKNHPEALYRLALIYHNGIVVECDHLKAYEFYTKSSKLGNEHSQKILNATTRSTIHSNKENQESFDISSSEIRNSLSLLKSVAKNGNIELQYSLGVFYYSDGENQDYQEAFSWFKMAADNDHVEAISYLGLLYEKGLGVEQDYNKSFELFNRANIHGSHFGLHQLGVAFHYGYGVDRSVEVALRCYTEAARLGNRLSQYNLGMLYKEGGLIQKDTMKALMWLTKAYHSGNYYSIDSLCDLYIDPPYEYYFHQRLFRIISKLEETLKPNSIDNIENNHIIHFKLGKMHFYGLGTPKNYAAALKHFIKAYYDYKYKDAEQFIPLEHHDSYFTLKSNYMEMLQAYSSIENELDAKQLYKLGMLYHDGAEIHYVDQNTPDISTPIAIIPKEKLLAFRFIKLASEKGNIQAQRQLGQIYMEENFIQKDYDQAKKWFNIAAESMSPHECYQEGMKYYRTIEGKNNLDISLIYLKKAAEKHYPDAQAQLAMISLRDNGIEKGIANKVTKIQDSVKLANPNDYYSLGMKFYNGTIVEKNYEISLIYLQKAADSNHVEAQSQLGFMYLHGYGVDRNYETSLIYLQKAADNNNAWAQAQLGIMYLQGKGVDQDPNKVVELIDKATEKMDPEKCYDQGMKFYKNTKVEKNYEISFFYLKKAAEKYYALALAQLGVMYFQGHGVEKKRDEAMRYIEQSLVGMTPRECYDQGMKFYDGREVEKNYELSLLYLRNAATKSYPKAQTQIGQMYLQGHGVEKNRAEALLWIKLSIKELGRFECYKQGMKFYKGTEVDKDYGISLIYIRKAAEDDSKKSSTTEQALALAQAQLGSMYLRDDGLEKCYEKAMDLIERSVKNAREEHCYQIGMEFYRAIEIDRNYEISLLYLKTGAKKGNPYSQAQLAYMYSKGIGVDEDHEQATRWRNRIKHGYPKHDTLTLAQIYHYDEDGIQDFSKALECYQKELYNRYSYYALRGIGLLYEYGDGVNQDYKKAMEYYQKSIGSSNVISCYNVGLLYYYGRGVDQSYIDALRWFTVFVGKNPLITEPYAVFIRNDSNHILDFAGYKENRYSLQPGSIFFGAAHYYLGLMYKNGQGTAQNNDRAQAHFRESFSYGIKHSKDFIVQ